MSRFYGDFDPASTASTTVVTLTTASRGIVEAVAQNFFPFESTAANLASGDGVFTSVGAFSYSSAVGTPYGAGTALRVENGAHMTITSAGAVQMMEFSSAFTFEFWAYRSSGANDAVAHQIIDSRNNNNNPNNCFLVGINSGKLTVSPGASGGANQQNASTVASLNVWQHYAIARDSSMQLRMFYDGVKKYDASYTIVSDNKADGGRPHFFETVNGSYGFTGYFRDLRIFKDVCIYTTAFTVTTQPLQATSNNIGISTSATTDTRSHSHVWNYSDVYDARFADTWPTSPFDSRISLYLPFDTDFADLSSYNHTPTESFNGAQYVQTSVAQFGGSAFFDNNDDYVTYDNHPSFIFGSEDFTVEGFFNSSEVQSDGLIGVWGGPSSGLRCWLISFSNYRLYAAFSTDGNSATSLDSGVSVSTGQWYNFSFTREGSTFRLFVDGVLKATATNSSSLKNSSQDLAVGSNNQSLTSLEYFGYLDDIRITKGLALYTTAYTVPTQAVGGNLLVNP
jgi:hypothetical protein